MTSKRAAKTSSEPVGKKQQTHAEFLQETLGAELAHKLKGRQMAMESASSHLDVYHRTTNVGPMAFVRELVQNELEANATKIRVGVDKAALLKDNIARFICGGNGQGFNLAYQKEKLATLAETGAKANPTGKNHGWGGRASLYWSSYNEYHSWQNGVGTCVAIFKDENGVVRYCKFPSADGAVHDSKPADEDLRSQFEIQDHGTVVKVYGRYLTSNSWEGEHEDAGVYHAVKFLNLRYFRAHVLKNKLGEPVTLQAFRFNTNKPDAWIKDGKINGGYYPVHGAEYYWDGACAPQHKASVSLGNGAATLHVRVLCDPKKQMTPEVPPRANWQSYMYSKGVFALAFENELYEGHEGPFADKFFSLFGANYSDMNSNLVFVLEMHKGAVEANLTRNGLVYLLTPGKKEIPLAEFGKEFMAKMEIEAPFLFKMLKAKASEELDVDTSKADDDLKDMLKSLEEIKDLVPLTPEQLEGLEDGGFGVVKKKKKLRPGPHEKKRKSKTDEPWPDDEEEEPLGPKWITFQFFHNETMGRGVVPASRVAHFIRNDVKVQVVEWEGIPQKLISSVAAKYAAYPHSLEAARKAFRIAIKRELGARVLLAGWQLKSQGWPDEEYDKAISTAALSTLSWVLIKKAMIDHMKYHFKTEKVKTAQLESNVKPY